ncbi:hypothetical protein ACJX0J_026282, partial [Zea mays]
IAFARKQLPTVVRNHEYCFNKCVTGEEIPRILTSNFRILNTTVVKKYCIKNRSCFEINREEHFAIYSNNGCIISIFIKNKYK